MTTMILLFAQFALVSVVAGTIYAAAAAFIIEQLSIMNVKRKGDQLWAEKRLK